MENLAVVVDLLNILLLIVLSVVVYRQSIDYKRVQELLDKAAQGAQKTETQLDDAAVSLAKAIFEFLGSLRAIHVEVKPEEPVDENSEDDYAEG